MPKKIEKSFDFYLEGIKQLISIASAIIAFSVVFSKDFLGIENVNTWMKAVLIVSWILFAISIYAGSLAINALTGQLDPGPEADPNHEPSIWAGPVRILVDAQQKLFIFGIVLILVFGGISIFQSSKTNNESPHEKDKVEIPIISTPS